MSSDPPRDTVGAVPEPPCPDAAWGGRGHPQPCSQALAMRAEPQRPLALAEANQQLPNSWLPF